MLVVAGFVSAGTANSADLAIEAVSTPGGSAATLQVRLIARSDQPAAIQFDLEHHPSLSFSGSAGPVVLESGKDVYSRSLAEGRTRFLIVGMNATSIADGIPLSLSTATGAAPGTYKVALRNTGASDPEGGELALAGAETILTIGSSIPEPPAGIVPHLAVGGGWKTTLSLLNSATAAAPVRVEAWNSGGGAWAVPWTVMSNQPGVVSGNSLELTIPPNAILDVVADSPASSTTALGWAQIFAPSGVAGWATLAVSLPSGQQAETVIPLGARSGVSFYLPFDNSNDYSTNVAIVNNSASGGAVVLVVARDAEGRHLFSDLLQLPVRGHALMNVAQKYSALAGTKGTLEFQNTRDGSIGVIGIKVHGSGTLAAINPVVKD